jgi:putative addiction module killer protein
MPLQILPNKLAGSAKSPRPNLPPRGFASAIREGDACFLQRVETCQHVSQGIRSEMIHFKRSDEFQEWLYSLRSKPVHGRVLTRLDNARMGNFGDCENVENGVSEMRIHYGPGYRVYFKRIGEVVYLLLIGGDKSTQKRDIERAKEIAEEFEKKE